MFARWLFTASVVGVAWGCRGGATPNISVSHIPPPPGCIQVGSVSAAGTGRDPARGALVEVKRQAAALGATYVQHDISSSGAGTLSGTAFRCTHPRTGEEVEDAPDASDARSAEADADSTSPEAAAPAPKLVGAGGFKLRESMESSSKACAEAGFTFTEGENGYFMCSGVPQTFGHPARTTLLFQNDSLSWIRFTVSPVGQNASVWTEAFDRLAGAIQTKYGAPTAQDVTEVEPCDATTRGECVLAGKVRLNTQWLVSPSERIELSLGVPPGRSTPLFHLIYDTTGQHTPSPTTDAL